MLPRRSCCPLHLKLLFKALYLFTCEEKDNILVVITPAKHQWFNECAREAEPGPYLCSIAMASLVLTWSRPKVREKRRANSLMPQNAEEERSNPWPSSDSISLNSCQKQDTKSCFIVWFLRQHPVEKKASVGTLALTCWRLRMRVFAHWILSICRVLLIVSLIMSP